LADLYVILNVRNVEGRTPLSLAAGAGHTRVMEKLLNHDTEPNLRDLRGASPLRYTAEAGYANVVKLLLARPADLNIKVRGGPDNANILHWQSPYGTGIGMLPYYSPARKESTFMPGFRTNGLPLDPVYWNSLWRVVMRLSRNISLVGLTT
jgi:ankyrin repeat protein